MKIGEPNTKRHLNNYVEILVDITLVNSFYINYVIRKILFNNSLIQTRTIPSRLKLLIYRV